MSTLISLVTVFFVGHRQTAQTKTRHCRTRHLIRVSTVFNLNLNRNKKNLTHHPFIPLFHTGQESPKSPLIEFFFIGGGGGGGGGGEIIQILIFYKSVPIQIRCRYEYSGESAQFGWNFARIHYDEQSNIRTCCTKVNASVKNTPNAARIEHGLTEIRDYSPLFARFSLTIVI